MSLSKHASTTYNARINFGKLLKLIPSQESQIKLLQVSYSKQMVNYFSIYNYCRTLTFYLHQVHVTNVRQLNMSWYTGQIMYSFNAVLAILREVLGQEQF